jgi:hypothetical protein
MAHFCCNVTPEHPVPLVRISSTSSFLQSFGGSGQFLRRNVVLAVTALLQHLRSVDPRAAQFSGCLCISLQPGWPLWSPRSVHAPGGLSRPVSAPVLRPGRCESLHWLMALFMGTPFLNFIVFGWYNQYPCPIIQQCYIMARVPS